MSSCILHLDDDLVAAAKPEGLASIPERDLQAGSVRQELETELRQKLFTVHRLDKEVSGVLLFARTAAAHRHLNAQFLTRAVRKSYLLLALGRLDEPEGLIDAPIREFGSGRSGIDPVGGKPSATAYRVLHSYDQATLVEARPRTGRRHQLRVHFYSIGHAIAGDLRYGVRREQQRWPRLMLHAASLEFTTQAGLTLSLTAPPPPSFQAVLTLLEENRWQS